MMSAKGEGKAKDYLKTLFDGMEEEVMVISKDYVVTEVNPALLKKFGYKKKDVIGKRCHEVSHKWKSPCKPPHDICPHKEVMKSGKQSRVVHTHFDKDGNEIYVELTAFPLKDKDGKITDIIEISRDITERIKAQDALRESEERLRDFFENANDLIQSVDASGNFVYVNKTWLETLGYSESELKGLKLTDVLRKDQISHCMELFKRVSSGEPLKKIETVFVAKDGREIVVEGNVNAQIKDGEFIATRAIFRDITERKEMEAALSKQVETTQKYLDLAGNILLVIETDQKVKVINREGCRVLGYKEEEIVGKNWFDNFLPKRTRKQVKEVFDKLIAGEVEQSRYYENSILTKSGEERLIAWRNTYIRDEEGNIAVTISSGEDITERRRAEEIQVILHNLLELSLEDIPLEELLEIVIDRIVSIPWLVLEKKGSIHLVEDDPKALVLKAQRGLHESLLTTCEIVPFGRCICGRAAATKKIAFTGCLDKNHENTYDGITQHGHYCVPILSGKRVLGVVNLYVKEGHLEDEREKDFLLAVANTLAGIIERKQAEDKLKETSATLQTAMDQSQAGIAIADSEGNIKFINEEGLKIGGKKFEELAVSVDEYVNSWQFYHFDGTKLKKDEVPLARAILHGEINSLEFLVRRPDKDIVVLTNAGPVKNEKGDTVGGVAVFLDITDRKRIEDALKASEEQFRELFEGAYDGMYLLDTEGRFTRVNKAFEEITGYEKKELLGKEMFEIVCREFRNTVKKRFESIIGDKEPLPIEFQILTKRGHIADIEARSSPVKEGDTIVGIQESARDISFRKALENELAALNEELTRYSEQLEQSNRMKGLFTDILRHDLLNPTGVIRNIAEIMEFDENLKGCEEIEVIKRNVKKLENIIQNASQYAKLESEEALEKTELNLTELIENIINDLRPYITEKKMKVEFKPGKEHKLNASGAIESVFVNILSNAIKYSPEGTDIKIAIEDDDKNKRISITDQGDGILDENKEAVFDRFTRKDKRGVKGTGLGLAITKRIVDLHNGRIWVEDNPEGKGSVFIVEIPK